MFFNQNNTDIVNLLPSVGTLLLLVLLPLLIFILYPAGMSANFIMSQSFFSHNEGIKEKQGGRSWGTAGPPVSASAGAPALAGSSSICAFVAKSVLSRFTRFWMYCFQPFMVMNGYFMIMIIPDI